MDNYTIFRLKLLKGLGNKGRLKALAYSKNHELKFEEGLFLEQLLGIQPRYRHKFQQSLIDVQDMSEENYLSFVEQTGFVTILDADYPEQLLEIYNPPIALFYQGDISLLQKNMLSVIGSREQTTFGKEMIDHIVPHLVNEDIVIVSGLAKGNDTYAHKTAIRHRGQTVGVLGSGHNYIYPKDNQHLQTYMAEHQLVLSEYFPHEKPLAYHFPERNRIIAGLSKGTIVIESKEKSGTFITAQLALEEGRDVFAIPNQPFCMESTGCLNLIKDGAKITTCAEDILEELIN